MPISRIQRVSNLIDRINNELMPRGESVYWYGPAPQKRIRKAEGVIGYSFPASFRAFLEQVGGGGLESFSILGLPDDIFLNRGSVIRMSDYWRDERGEVELPEHLLVIEHSEDGDEPFCLDLSSFSGDECPVVLYYPYDGRVDSVAPTFIDFWEDFTGPYFEVEEAKPKASKKAPSKKAPSKKAPSKKSSSKKSSSKKSSSKKSSSKKSSSKKSSSKKAPSKKAPSPKKK